ncbi:hypothetical protein BDF20DRAFT_691928 [Mycotypha africana]|uniref:uncharacterized protein n=1 Tax=Mycotypha africana TaxID=64632 RepID=UPI002300A264|nr:uncharacterized protein BDF20DRAFT_691928 [Mycotypha africana]KAI8971660.1 hypothetical protein BDF20DRAFT_691928 [Mycotypha africana]
MDFYREEPHTHDHSRWRNEYPEEYYDGNNNILDYPNRDHRQEDASRYPSIPEEKYFADTVQPQTEKPISSATPTTAAESSTATSSSIDETTHLSPSTSIPEAEATSSFAFLPLSSMPAPLTPAIETVLKQEHQRSASSDRSEIKKDQSHAHDLKSTIKKASVGGDNAGGSTSFHLPPGTNLGLVGKLGAYQVAHKKPVSAGSSSFHQHSMLEFYLLIFFVTFFVMKKKY